MLRKAGIALLVAAYAAPWPVAMGCALALNGLVLALIPIRRGEKWALRPDSIRSVGHSDLHRPALFGGARSAPARLPHLHGFYGFRLGRPRAGRPSPFQGRRVSLESVATEK